MKWTLIFLGTLVVCLAYLSVSDAQTCSVVSYRKATRSTCRTRWWRRRCTTTYYSTSWRQTVCCSGYSGSPPSCNDINECTGSIKYCQHNCANTPGSYTCSCNSGYQINSDGRSCSDIDECKSSSTNNCEQTCVNTPGSFRCSCNQGYTPNTDGRTCSDIDECSTTHACNHNCSNTVGSYTCSCRDGFSLIPGSTTTCQGVYLYKTCYRTVRRTTSTSCWLFFRCRRVVYARQSYTCKGGCKSGYSGENCATATCDGSHSCRNGGTCIGPNTCSCRSGYKPPVCESVCTNHQCDHICVPSGNTYICQCNAGYTLQSDGRSCADIDECKSSSTNNCQQNCVNTLGSFRCSCNQGYKLNVDNSTCSDIDECSTTNACNHICSNTVGSYTCSCRDGFSLIPGSTTTCQGLYSYTTCYRSVRRTLSVRCGFNGLSRCRSVTYSREAYNCSAGCKSGYTGNHCATATCDGSLTCPNGGTCIGPNTCSCRTGYKPPRCESVCKNHECDHICVADGNSYICQCNAGYILQSDGRSCVVSDPCTQDNGQCDHVCKYTRPGRHDCSCHSGFVLSYDGRSCYDINECLTLPCDHICTNSPGSYSCTCKSGYTASQNGTRCTVNSIANVSAFILFTDSILQKIYKMDLKTRVYQDLKFTGMSNPIAIDWDYNTGLVFWTDVGKKRIYRGLLDGSQQQVIRLLHFYAVPDGIAVDSNRRLIFYSETYADVIARMDFRGLSHKNIIYNVTEPRAIVLDTANELIYWTDWGAVPRIGRTDYDGLNQTVLVSEGIRWPNGLALDLKDERLFWADAFTQKIEFVKLDGTGRTEIYSSLNSHYFDIVAMENFLFFSDWKRGGLRYLQKDGRNPLDFGASGFGRINGLFLHDDGQNYDEDLADTEPEACKEDEICIDFDLEGSMQASLEGVSLLYGFSGKTSRDCSRQAVFKVTFDPLSSSELCHTGTYGYRQMLKVDVFLSPGQRSGWLLNIGDSIGNNGYGGDAGQSDMAHELQIVNGNITSYASTFNDTFSNDCRAQRLWTDKFVSGTVNQVTFYIANNYFLVTNDAGQTHKLCNKCLFGLDGRFDYRAGGKPVDTNIYIGVNRVISSPYRNGYGTCSMKLSWVEGPPISDNEDEPGDTGGSDSDSGSSGSSGTSGSDSSGTSGSDSSGTSDSDSSGTSGSDSSGTSGSDSSGTSDSDSSGTSGSDSSGTSGSDSSGTSGSDSGGTSDSDSSGTSGSDSSGTSGSDSSGTSGSDSSGTSGSDSGGTSDSDSSGTSGSDPSSDSDSDGTSGSDSGSTGSSNSDSGSSGTSTSGSGSESGGTGSDGDGSGSDGDGSGTDGDGSGSDADGSGTGGDGSGSDGDGSGTDGDGSGSTGDGSGTDDDGSGSTSDGSGSDGDGSGSDGDVSGSDSDGSGTDGDGSESTGDGSGTDDDGSGSTGDGSGSDGDGSGSGSYGDDSSCNGLTNCSRELLLSSLIVSNTDCRDYCQCRETRIMGVAQYAWRRSTCGAGHRWNGTTRYCDLKDRYECTSDSAVEPGDSQLECLGTCAGPNDENKLASRNNTGCVQFCLCVQEPDNTYRWQTLFCHHGSLWASAENRCIGEYQMNCLGNGTGVYTPPDDSEDTAGDDDLADRCDVEQCLEKQKQDLMLLPYSNCSKFCQCVPKETLEDGTVLYSWQVKECALGAYWSHRSRQCGETNPEACKAVVVVGYVEEDDVAVSTPVWKGPRVFNCSGVCTEEFHGSFTSQLFSNCTQYCHCTRRGNNPNYEWIPALCAPGTSFESNRRQCLHSDDVLCQEDGYGVYIGPPEEEPGDTGNDEDCPLGGCSAISSGNVLVVKNTTCTKYCKCFPYTVDESGNVEYRWVVLECPDGQTFNVLSSECETNEPLVNICSENSTSTEDAKCYGRCTQAEWGSLNVSKDPDCRSFCQCAPLNNDPAFYWQIMNCGTNTRFSLNDSTCVHENNANCTGADDSGSDTEGTCPVDSCKYIQNLNLMALPGSDCRKFCQCAPLKTYGNGTVEYTWVIKDCAPGTRWKNTTGNCGSFDEETYECIDSTSTGGSEILNDGCPDSCDAGELDDFIAAVDSTCVSYCQCAPRHNGGFYWQKMYCAPGTKFDKEKKLCLFSNEVMCDGGS